ncbi:MAG: hypothetical protein ABI210_07250 [Abditibacteriaceae bacterium]
MSNTYNAISPEVPQNYPPFSLSRLLKTVFHPKGGERVCILIDLEDPKQVKDFAFLQDTQLTIQRYAHDVFYEGLKNGVSQELNFKGGEFYAYKITGGSNLDMPDEAFAPDGRELSFQKDIYPNYDLILCISTYSATAPLTAWAKKFGFRGATLHGVNQIILETGLSVDYDKVSAEAEQLRLGMTKADWVEIDFGVNGKTHTLRLILNGQEAQKSHGLCRGPEPDIANLPAGEIYYTPESAEGEFPLKYEKDGTISLCKVENGRVVSVSLISGNEQTVKEHQEKLSSDPETGTLGELGFGTQLLPFSGRDIQDEKIRGTIHVATGRNDHLGGTLVPEMFEVAKNATHDDILFAPHKTPEINIAQARMHRDGKQEILIENYLPSAYMKSLVE